MSEDLVWSEEEGTCSWLTADWLLGAWEEEEVAVLHEPCCFIHSTYDVYEYFE